MADTNAGQGGLGDVSELCGLLLALRDTPGVNRVTLESWRWMGEFTFGPWSVIVDTEDSARTGEYAAHGRGPTPEAACSDALKELRSLTTEAQS